MLRVTVTGTKEARHLVASLSGRELQNRSMRGFRAGSKVFRTAYRSEVKSRSDLPGTFAKTKTRQHRTPLGVSVGPSSPLINIFEGGADSHEIAPGGQMSVTGHRAMLLAGPAGDRWRTRPMLASEPVTHPGMGARPSVGPVFEREQDKASDAAMDTILAGLRR